ncbi:hypothetical protein Q5P01_011720 [Channa striata]|uniref:Uncharacterized protein n=1 Tax=Channa striata TaxID=64152 RepID=A0AA88MTU9_CHASR|nr:hypothetical protein Q5P01_011720 [Channa striata]
MASPFTAGLHKKNSSFLRERQHEDIKENPGLHSVDPGASRCCSRPGMCSVQQGNSSLYWWPIRVTYRHHVGGGGNRDFRLLDKAPSPPAADHRNVATQHQFARHMVAVHHGAIVGLSTFTRRGQCQMKLRSD